jgi:hypothetical protein
LLGRGMSSGGRSHEHGRDCAGCRLMDYIKTAERTSSTTLLTPPIMSPETIMLSGPQHVPVD